MSQKSPFTLNSIHNELELKALIHFSKNYEAIEHIGQESFINAIIKSNIQAVMESEIAPIIDIVLNNNPSVYIKSHPKGREDKSHIEVHLSTKTEDPRAEEKLQKAVLQLSNLIRNIGGKVKFQD